MERYRNWAGNVTFSTTELHRPESVAELCRLLAGSSAVRALGTGHSFNEIADTTGALVSVAGLPRVIELDSAGRRVRVSAGLRYGEITGELDRHGLALANLGSLPHISVGGACATGTHGSGDTNQVLAAAAAACTLATATGELVTLDRADQDFGGAVLSLGCLGVLTELTLDLVDSFEIYQYVYEDLALSELLANFDELTAAAYSFSLFTDWRGERIDQVWLKSRTPRPSGEPFFGARPAARQRHPVPGGDPGHSTVQLGRPGPWQARLPHFRLEFTPSSGDEIQSEYFIDRGDAAAAFEVLSGLGERLAPVLQVAEVRTVAADELWISPARGRDRVALHFTWVNDRAALQPVLRELEEALSRFEAVPHWGKVTALPDASRAAHFPGLPEFAALVRRYDPAGTFANQFTSAVLNDPKDP